MEKEIAQEVFTWTFSIKTAKTYSFSDLFTEYHAIPLETSEKTVFSHINRMSILNKSFVIHSPKGSQFEVLIFNEKGEFIWRSPLGQGPNEFNMIWGFSVNEKKDEIVLFEPRRMVFLNSKGDILHSVRYSQPVGMLMGEHFYADDYLICRNMQGKFFRIEMDGEVDSLFSDQYGFDGTGASIQKTFENPLIRRSFDHYLYTIKDGSFMPKYMLDFGSNSIPLKGYLKYDDPNWATKLYNEYYYSDYVYDINHFSSSGSGKFIFTATFNQKPYSFLCTEETKSYIIIKHTDIGIGINYLPIFLKNDLAYFIISPMAVLNQLEGSPDKENQWLFGQIKDLKIDDNPIIVQAHFK